MNSLVSTTLAAVLAILPSASAQTCAPRWTPTFGGTSQSNGAVKDLVVWDDGTGSKLYACGHFTRLGGTDLAFIGCWDGTQWSPLGSGLSNWAQAMLVHDDGTGEALYVAGAFTHAGGDPAARFVAKWDGTQWSGLGSGLNGVALALTEHDFGSGADLVVGGDFTTASGVFSDGVVRWTGTSWLPLASGVEGRVSALVSYDNGTTRVLLAGHHTTPFLSAWSGSNWGTGLFGLDNAVEALVQLVDGVGFGLYVGGRFTAGFLPVASPRTIRLGGDAASVPMNGGCNFPVLEYARFDDGTGAKTFVGGVFSTSGGVTTNRIAGWDGTNWSTLGTGMSGFGSLEQGSVYALAVYDDGRGPALFAGGDFTNAGGSGDAYLGRWGCIESGLAVCAGDGSGTACPCGNASPAGEGRGCLNSFGVGAKLVASGDASVSADTLVLSGSAMPNASVLYFQGTSTIAGGSGSVFGDGLRCAGGVVQRLGTRTNANGRSRYPGPGDVSISVRGAVTAGSSRTYQAWYRNAASFCTSSTFNLTNGVVVDWAN